jgi:hypothetical protein
LGLVAIDQALQYKQELESKQHQEILLELQREADQQNVIDFDVTLPSKFQCKLLHVEPSLDGTKMLTRNLAAYHLRKGDIVEILEENVGPNQAYHLCRYVNKANSTVVVGWYPVQFMQRIN